MKVIMDARMDLRMTQDDRERIADRARKAGYRFDSDYVKDKSLGITRPSKKKRIKELKK